MRQVALQVLLDESEVEMLFKGRSKLFAQSSAEKVWKDRGMGQLVRPGPSQTVLKPHAH
jgi:hypothetical protein